MGWAIRLGMGRSEVPDVHIHNTKCFPRVSPQPQALAPSLPSSRAMREATLAFREEASGATA